MTAWVFFSISFAAAFKKEEEYFIYPFLMDVFELLEMIVCFLFLKILEPIPEALLPHLPSLRGAYITLSVAVVMQLIWRKIMGLKWNSFIDLKAILTSLLIIGAMFGESVSWLNWFITVAFTVSAALYVSMHPYGPNSPTWFFSR